MSRGYHQGYRQCTRHDRHVVRYSYERVYLQGDSLAFLTLYGLVTAPACAPLRGPLGLVDHADTRPSGVVNGIPWIVNSSNTIHTATCHN
jgi:hypothetical protein